jgi:hypothetical protein
VQELLSLVGNRPSDAWCAWPSDATPIPDRRSMLAALGVMQPHALAADEGHRVSASRLQHVAGFARLDLFECRG